MDLKKKIGEYLKECRKDRGMTLEELARAAGVSKPYLSQLENGKFKPSPEMLKKLSAGLRVRYSDLLWQAGYEELYNAERFREAQEDFDIIPNGGERSHQELKEYVEAARRLLSTQEQEKRDFYASRPFDFERLMEDNTDLRFRAIILGEKEKRKLLFFLKYILLEMELKEEG